MSFLDAHFGAPHDLGHELAGETPGAEDEDIGCRGSGAEIGAHERVPGGEEDGNQDEANDEDAPTDRQVGEEVVGNSQADRRQGQGAAKS